MLAELGRRFGLSLEAVAALERLLALIAEDPEAPTTVREPMAAADVHVADALVALELEVVARAARVADLGSGVGVPGLVLAAALPGARVGLVESAERRCRFLRRAVDAMAVANAEVVCARAEAWPEGVGGHDLVTARALAPLPVLVEYAAPLLRVGGWLAAWKGRRDPGEEADGAAAADVLGLRVGSVRPVQPFSAARDRHIHLFVKVAPTPAGYPRRPGMARKRPLRAWPGGRPPAGTAASRGKRGGGGLAGGDPLVGQGAQRDTRAPRTASRHVVPPPVWSTCSESSVNGLASRSPHGCRAHRRRPPQARRSSLPCPGCAAQRITAAMAPRIVRLRTPSTTSGADLTAVYAPAPWAPSTPSPTRRAGLGRPPPR